MQGITEKIKELAKQQRLSIRQIEIAAGLSNGSITRWSEKSPSIDKVYRVANVLGCTVDDLIRKDEEPTEPIFKEDAEPTVPIFRSVAN